MKLGLNTRVTESACKAKSAKNFYCVRDVCTYVETTVGRKYDMPNSIHPLAKKAGRKAIPKKLLKKLKTSVLVRCPSISMFLPPASCTVRIISFSSLLRNQADDTLADMTKGARRPTPMAAAPSI